MASGIQSRGSLTITGLRRKLAQFDGPGYRAELAQVCAAAAGKLVNDGFRKSVDPYGTAWEPLKSRVGKRLLRTGRLRASFAVSPTSGGFRIDSTASYGKFQQYGTAPHRRAERGARQNARGRFVSSRAKTSYLLRIRAHTNGGIPARPMVPTPDLGGLPIKWQRTFYKEAVDLVKRLEAAQP